jgi:hypothetical protein
MALSLRSRMTYLDPSVRGPARAVSIPKAKNANLRRKPDVQPRVWW